ncbi:MAG: FixH family protein [Pseudomonadota bacterium]|nr:MAG: hypothetical protein DIU56_00095 [Pseudomonadota bacterium]
MSTDRVARDSTNSSRGWLSPALIVAVAIPTVAVVASLATVALALAHGDRELPAEYHWEGFRLDRDFARFERAFELDVRGTLEIDAGQCRLALEQRGSPSQSIELHLAHATLPKLDRRVTLQRVGSHYEAACDPVPAGSWWVEISDPEGEWAVRQHVWGSLAQADIAARSTRTEG